MSDIISNLVWLGLAAGVIALIYGAYAYFRDDEDEEDEEELDEREAARRPASHAADTQELPELDGHGARRSRMLALKDSLERSLQMRGGIQRSGLDRLAMPWFMLVGTEGSGKRSMLASTGLPLPYGPPVEVDGRRKDAGRWWLFENAVVVEAPTVKAPPRGSGPSETTASVVVADNSEGWNNLLGLLRRERPDSPLNGIVVTISCADLFGSSRKSPEELTEQAQLVCAFLDKTRRTLGVRLPLHLVITRCDVIPGFRSFSEMLPDSRRDDIFGWTNPNPIETPFDPAWVENGFTELTKSLEMLHDELLAAPDTIRDADGLFVFVNEFPEIQDALVDFAKEMLPTSEGRPAFFFRGIYFTGDPSETAAKARARQDDDATLHISMEATDAESNSLVFLRSVFVDKVFPEAGLAKSAARVRISRDKRVLAAQAATILIALLGGAGLYRSLYGYGTDGGQQPGLTASAAEMSRVLSGVAIDVDELKRGRQASASDAAFARRATDAAMISLVAELQQVEGRRLRSPFVPSSWFSPVPRKIDASMVDAIQTLVLPVARLRLQERFDRLVGRDALANRDPGSVAAYLSDVGSLSRNVARFNALAHADSGTTADLLALTDYLFGQRPGDSTITNESLDEALRVATVSPIVITPAHSAAIVARSVELVGSASDDAARRLLGGSSPDPMADIAALRHLHVMAEMTDPKTGLVSRVADSTPLGARAARQVQDSISARFAATSVRLLKDPMLPDQAAARMRAVLGELFSSRLMDSVHGREITDELRPGEVMTWDLGQLELVFVLRGDLTRAQIAVAEAFPEATSSRLRPALDAQMRGRAVDLTASAQRFSPDTSDAYSDIRSASENLSAAGERLVRLSALFDTIRAASQARRATQAAVRQAEHALGLAQGILDTARYLAPQPAAVAAWRGGYPVGFAAMGVSDTGAFNHRLDRDQVPNLQLLASSVQPVVEFLMLPIVDSVSMIDNRRLFSDWRGIVAGADRNQPTALVGLHQYISSTMGGLDVPSCQAALARNEAATTSDWFEMRRRQFRATMVGRCGPGGAEAAQTYRGLRELFTSRLAGRYPFVDAAAAASAPEASPEDVREFFTRYDAFVKGGEQALRADPRMATPGRAAFAFLDELAAVRPFFGPIVDGASYDIAVIPAPNEPPRELHVGSAVLPIEGVVGADWAPGEPVRVVSTDGDSTSNVSAVGRWAAVKVAAAPRSGLRLYHPRTGVHLRVPASFPKVAPVIPSR